jgi:protein TonB
MYRTFSRQVMILAILFAALPAIAQEAQEPLIRVNIEEFATFPGGVEQFYEYVQNNQRYPASALRDSLGGVVYVEFMLGKDGTIDKGSLKVVKSLSPDCDQEAIRLIAAAPSWSPARSKEGAAAQSIIFPVSFEWTKE